MDKVAKAVTAALLAAYGIFELATTVDSAGGGQVTSAEGVRIAVAAIVAGLAVWAVPNTPGKSL